MSSKWRTYLSPNGIFRELGIILTCLVCVVGVWAFIIISDRVTDNKTRSLDEYVMTSFRTSSDLGDPIGPEWSEEIARDVTALGSKTLLTFIVLAVAGFLFLKKQYAQGWLIILVSLAGVLLGTGLKMFFVRERPDLVPHLSSAYNTSFPSGHTMMSAVIYISLAAMLSFFQKTRRVKFYSITIALVATFLVGLSRIYLGVHYPTDVLAGWAVGLAWAAFCWVIFRYINYNFIKD